MALSVPAVLCAYAPNAAVTNAQKLTKEGKYEEAVAALEAELKKSPKSLEVKNALAATLTAQGESVMFNKDLRPMVKYPTALRHFRKAVEHNPNAAKAKEHIATIENIYKSMGREVPK